MLGEAWRSTDEKGKQPYQTLAEEEVRQFAKEQVLLLEKVQKPDGAWQPLRRIDLPT